MKLSPDQTVYGWIGPIPVNATIAHTWLVMALLVLIAWLATRRLSVEAPLSRWQNFLEIIVGALRTQIREASRQEPAPYLPFIGTLFLFLALCNTLAVVPGFQPPTASLSTTAALAGCVFVAVPLYGLTSRGLWGYLAQYVKPNVFMLPFNLIGEASRTLALAVRLYGNMMSGTVIVAILLSLAPFFFPVLLQLLGLVTGLVQAYIFSALAMVYIASAAAPRETPPQGD